MNKLNNKTLIAVLGILISIFAITKITGNNGDRTLKETLYTIDTASIDKIVITPMLSSENKPFSLEKNDGKWVAKQGEIEDNANINIIKSAVGPFQAMKPQRLVALNNNRWKNYEVTDSLGTKVQVYADGSLVADLMIGKFSYNNTTRKVYSFVKPANGNEVFAIDGALSSTFRQAFSAYRDKSFLKFNPSNIKSVRFDYPADSSFVLNKMGNTWQIDGQTADSTATANFLSKIQNKSMNDFKDNFDIADKQPQFKVTFEGDNMAAIEVSCYEDESLAYIMHSTQNRNNYFTGGSINLFEELYVSKSKFLKKENE